MLRLWSAVMRRPRQEDVATSQAFVNLLNVQAVGMDEVQARRRMLPALGCRSIRADRVALLGATLLIWLLWFVFRGPLTFDDAYMFHRYGEHLLNGHGIVWNVGGPPTYGLTSQLWLFVLLPFLKLPLSVAAALQFASWLMGGLAIVVMARVVAREAQSAFLREAVVALGIVGLPLLLHPAFGAQLTTGMDTMLSLLANAALILAVGEYSKAPSTRLAIVSGLISVACILTRPENGICALGVPLLSFVLVSQIRPLRDLVWLVALPLGFTLVSLVAARAYYGSALPLSFYAKAAHGYDGFLNPESAVRYLVVALSCVVPFIVMGFIGRRRGGRSSMVLLAIPAALTVCYLLTVRQIMGWNGRFFIPFIPYAVCSGVLLLDRALARGLTLWDLRVPFARGVGVGFVAILAVLELQRNIGILYPAMFLPEPVAAPRLEYRAQASLPDRPWFSVVQRIGDDVISRLPAGSSVAASEVGYIGSVAPDISIIDLVGLNDTSIGRAGLSTDYLFNAEPDIIWLPHRDYTGLRSRLLSDVRLYDRYTVIVDAFSYGIAIRRDSPRRALIEERVAAAWKRLYPDFVMADYVVLRKSENPRGSSE